MFKLNLSLRAHLALFAGGIGLPLLFLAVAVGWTWITEQRAQTDEAARRYVSQMANDVQRELAAFKSAAQMLALALSDSVGAEDYARFHAKAREAPLRAGSWVVVTDVAGRQLVNTRVSFGTPLPGPVAEHSAEIAALARGETVLTDPFPGPVAGRLIFTVAVPVKGETGAVIGGLSLAIPVEFLTELIREIRIPKGWVATLNDRQHRIAARTLEPEKWVGGAMSATGRAASEHVRPGEGGLWNDVLSVDGRQVRGALYRLPNGWLVTATAMQEVYEASVWRVATFGAAFVILFTCTSLVLASLLARRILSALNTLSLKAKALGERRVLDAPPTPIPEFNTVINALCEAAEELVRREGHQKLLVDELNHRVKNTLATVQALARRSFRGSDPKTYATFEARLMALSDSHNLLTEANWSGVSLRALVRRELNAYSGRATTDGIDMILPPKAALGLSMTVHELATNAAKHGALSTPAGRVQLRWKVEDGELVLSWQEQGGPIVAPPARRGFGSTLIRKTIDGDLGGRIDHHFPPEGVTCDIRVPLAANQAAYVTEVA